MQFKLLSQIKNPPLGCGFASLLDPTTLSIKNRALFCNWLSIGRNHCFDLHESRAWPVLSRICTQALWGGFLISGYVTLQHDSRIARSDMLPGLWFGCSTYCSDRSCYVSQLTSCDFFSMLVLSKLEFYDFTEGLHPLEKRVGDALTASMRESGDLV